MQNTNQQKIDNSTTWITGALNSRAPADLRAAAIDRAHAAFRLAEGDVKRAAKIIGIDYTSLYRLLNRHPDLRTELTRAREAIGWTR